MKYNDELLCPEIYEEMAREYQKNLKIKTPKNNNEILNKLFAFFNELNSNIIFLNNIKNISTTSKKYLTSINKIFENIKKINPEFNYYNTFVKSNYCECLTNSIFICTSCIKEICQQSEFSLELINITNHLSNIIENLSCMYGICMYRKI